MNLKIATWDDYFDARELVKNFVYSSPYVGLSIDQDKLDEVLKTLLTGDKAKGIVLLALDDRGKAIGMLAGQISEMLLNRDRIAHELMWWIEPNARNSKAGLELLEAFEFWARKVGCKAVQMSLLETDTADRIGKLYSRKGYKFCERSYFKGLN